MSKYTYEAADRKERLETYEWDRAWIDHATDLSGKRVLYIGDSISDGTRELLVKKADGAFYVDGFATSKGIDNPYFQEMLDLYLRQEERQDVILFNNGLHGWHLSEEEYEYHYEEMIKFLMTKNENLFLLLTTHLANADRVERVLKRNDVVKALAKKYNVSVIDLYTPSASSPDLLFPDGVHFEPAGYTLLAETIIDAIGEKING